ncbi:MAG: glycosyl transferase group 1 [Proteobacteria bacterium]|nr:glycosyl transferase group 1 [Pseudomonadota bacterium]
MRNNIVFVWDNFGPIHADRASAVAQSLTGVGQVTGVELFAKSDTYDWKPEGGESFKKVTICRGAARDNGLISSLRNWFRLQKILWRNLGSAYFFCHYERPSIFFSAAVLRLIGQKTYVMNDSKFDDYERNLFKEFFKYVLYIPYRGGVAASTRSQDYMRFLGVPEKNIATCYDSMSISRIRRSAGCEPAPNGAAYGDRHFTVVARLVEKKNLFLTLSAYAEYAKNSTSPRRLKIAGNGPLESALKQHAVSLGVSGLVDFMGFIQAEDVARLLSTTVALLLLSTEEQFGNVVIEAISMGLPCIVSTACGSRDQLIRSGVNGFVVEPDNAEGAAYFMSLIAQDESLWQTMARASSQMSAKADVSCFVESVSRLIRA